jgi:multicomponent Na+:H+ antiporter subunit G
VSALADAFTIVAVTVGLVFFVAGTAGLLRFPDTRSRLHALTKADHLGLGLVVTGLLPQQAGVLPAAKLVAVWGLVLLAGACAGPMIAALAREEEEGP